MRSAGQTPSKRGEEPRLLYVAFPIRYIDFVYFFNNNYNAEEQKAPGKSSPVDRLEREEGRREGKGGEVLASFQD